MTSADEPYGLFDAEFLFSFLTAVEPTGETALGRATHEFVLRNRRRLDRFCGGLRRFALTRGITFLETSTATAFEDLILRYLREAMVLA